MHRTTYHRAAVVSLIALTFGVGTAAAAGQQAGKAEKSGAEQTTRAGMAGDFKGRHTMQGEVTKIDSQKGTFSLKTGEGMELDLHAPPSALQGVKEGDRLAVEIAVKPSGMAGKPKSDSPAASPATGTKGDASKPAKTR